jgi:excisionase family DNA binding protein
VLTGVLDTSHHAGREAAPGSDVDNQFSEAGACQTGTVSRFLKLSDVCEMLNISTNQAYSLLNSGELRGIQVGGRGIWRIETTELESYIQRLYEENDQRIERERSDELTTGAEHVGGRSEHSDG